MSDPLLSVDGARALILAESRPRPAEAVAVERALGRVLAQDVTAARDVPPFAGSAMDRLRGPLRPGRAAAAADRRVARRGAVPRRGR